MTLLLSSRTQRELYTISDDQVVESEQAKIMCLWIEGRQERGKEEKGKKELRVAGR